MNIPSNIPPPQPGSGSSSSGEGFDEEYFIRKRLKYLQPQHPFSLGRYDPEIRHYNLVTEANLIARHSGTPNAVQIPTLDDQFLQSLLLSPVPDAERAFRDWAITDDYRWWLAVTSTSQPPVPELTKQWDRNMRKHLRRGNFTRSRRVFGRRNPVLLQDLREREMTGRIAGRPRRRRRQ
jgi:hypothetical protein